jgi:hypothetical protein
MFKRSLIATLVALVVSAAAFAATATAAPKSVDVSRPVTGTVTPTGGTATPFTGTLTIDRVVKTATGLAAVGTVTGIPGVADQAVTLPLQATGTCDILHLTLGPLDLNLLGLVVHLDQVVLDITAEQGPGNLLGNLLCAVAGLLDPPTGGGGGLGGLLQGIVNLLNQILGQL